MGLSERDMALLKEAMHQVLDEREEGQRRKIAESQKRTDGAYRLKDEAEERRVRRAFVYCAPVGAVLGAAAVGIFVSNSSEIPFAIGIIEGGITGATGGVVVGLTTNRIQEKTAQAANFIRRKLPRIRAT